MRLAIVGLGRIGQVHAQHAQEVARELGGCTVTAVVDPDELRAQSVAAQLSAMQDSPVRHFPRIAAMLAVGAADVSIVSTPTGSHRADATALVEAGHRILLEKPLTGSFEEDRAFAAWLDAHHPQAVMLAFQRRFDEPLQFARRLLADGAIGKPFKIVSILEDSGPAPDGYVSGGILADMAVHNVDEVLWLADGRRPVAALALGHSLHSRRISRAVEDFDDASLTVRLEGGLVAQIAVSRNHVSGYRVETWIYGESGQIHIGRFEQRHHEVLVEAYGERRRQTPLALQRFQMRRYPPGLPEFVDRFGDAYRSEVREFVRCCRNSKPFPVTHRDGLRAMEVIGAGMRALVPESAASVIER